MNRIVGVYKAEIYEYENGDIKIAYECDKDNNCKCNKRNCKKDCCTHTFDKRFAKSEMRKENKIGL
uniref:Uncharacterized protein n=1 Tax=Myoviridae sp. ct2Pw37 TaxID=2825021 RepID=A0A8S5PBQ7_9CAUD|nr:MAG TPA: hypothetical protein [Myoviridae sp. ct2Pw37]